MASLNYPAVIAIHNTHLSKGALRREVTFCKSLSIFLDNWAIARPKVHREYLCVLKYLVWKIFAIFWISTSIYHWSRPWWNLLRCQRRAEVFLKPPHSWSQLLWFESDYFDLSPFQMICKAHRLQHWLLYQGWTQRSSSLHLWLGFLHCQLDSGIPE